MSYEFRKDTHRFREVNYIREILQLYFKIDGSAYSLTDKDKKNLQQEFLDLNMYWKGAVDVVANIAVLGVSYKNAVDYFALQVKIFGQTSGGVRSIMNYTLQITKEGQAGAKFIAELAKRGPKIAQILNQFKANSSGFLAFLVILQVGVHAVRQDWAKCVAELAKSALSAAIPLMALMDLVDSTLGLILPEWVLKQPVVQVLRGMNPAQCTFYMTENFCWLIYCGTKARQQGWGAFNKALDAWCVKMEQSPMVIYTFLARDTAVILNDVLPDCMSNFSIYGASIRNLADYTRANPATY